MSKAAEPVVLVASSEFTLKSSPVRRTLEQRLIDDLKFALRRGNLECSRVEREAARFVVFGVKQTDTAAAYCSRIFGVAYAASARLLTNPNLDEITTEMVELAQRHLSPGQSFAVRAHRSTSGHIARRDVELQGGAKILSTIKDQGTRVNLDAPDVTFHVDLVGEDAYLYCERLKGPGGLPLSAQWKMLTLLDCGPLSILAACAMMRRGCVTELLVPLSTAIPNLSAKTQLPLAEKLAKLVTRPNHKAFTLEIDELLAARNPKASWRVWVRAMALGFAQENRFKGVVFGDISGRLPILNSANVASNQPPVFHPLLGLERQDLTELSNLVGIDDSELLAQGSLMDRSIEPQAEIGLKLDELGLSAVQELRF